MVNIEDVANRNHLNLCHTSKQNQYKAHCPVCKDRAREYHLYVNVARGVFCCHRCGISGGVIQFHAWLRGISFEDAKRDLYPPSERKTPRYVHPAEKLTREQLAKLGYSLRSTRKIPPNGVDAKMWARRRKAELDMIWTDWMEYQKVQQERDAFWAAFEQKEGSMPLVSSV